MEELKFPELGGYCTSANLFIKRTGKPDPFGIISEQIFGPISSYRCSCGNLKHKTLDFGKKCPRCGVLCIDNESRLTTFGKIKTIFPFIKTTKKVNILKYIGKRNKQLLDPTQSNLNLSLSKFICYGGTTGSEIMIIDDISSVPSGYTLIPFRITGIFTLIFIFRFLSAVIGDATTTDFFKNKFIDNEIEVLPPEMRPVFPDPENSKTLFFEEVNSHYISLLNSNKRNKLFASVIEEDISAWADSLTEKMKVSSTDVFEDPSAIEFDQITSFYQFYVDAVYDWCFEKIKGKYGLIRSVILSRTLEFSARTVVAVDPSTQPYEIKLPRSALFVLWMPYFLNYLVNIRKIMQYDECYFKVAIKKYYEVQKDPILHTYFLEFLTWFTESEEATKVIDY